MKLRLTYLVRLYAMLLLVFVLQKPVFMLFTMPEAASYGPSEWLGVMLHGLLLDIPVAGYLTALPLLAVIATCLLPCGLRLRRWALPYYAVAALVTGLIFISDISLYPFWKFKLDATVFFYIDSPSDAMASVSAGYIALRAVLILVYAALLFEGMRRVTPAVLPPLKGRRSKAAGAVLFLLLAVPLAISIRGGLGESTTNIGKVYFSEDEYLNHSAVNPCFSLIYSLGKAENYGDEFNYFDERRRAGLFGGLYPATPTDTVSLLNTTRPNILIILMESFGGQIVEAAGGRADITPHYNRLAREGIFFRNCYSNSFRTDRGMVSALSGYPAFPTLSVMKLPVKSRTLPCIAASLNAGGYRSTFLYGGDINFTNMQSYLRTGGYGTIISDVDFDAADKKDNPWGANDDVTFNRLYDIIVSQRHTPWHIGFLTLSSHEPFEVPYSRLKEQVPNAFAFTDECLGRFVERVKKTDLWRNLLIVCIPDHGYGYPTGISHEQHHHNTMLWTGGAVRSPRVVSTVMNQSDMAATLLGQLRMGHDKYTFSRDVFSEEYKYPFAFFTSKEYIGFADSTGHTVYGITGNRVIEEKNAIEGHATVRTDRAKAILQSIYDDLGGR